MNVISLDQKKHACHPSLDFYISGNTAIKQWSDNDSYNSSASIELQERKVIVKQYKNEILNTIRNDQFEDGMISNSERYMTDCYTTESKEYIKEALMELYMDYLDNAHVLTGILVMISSVPYDSIAPQGQIMSMGLLQNKSLEVRDRSIQAFERWNSKKGISVLQSLNCDKKWMQKYVDKVIMYLERDGID